MNTRPPPRDIPSASAPAPHAGAGADATHGWGPGRRLAAIAFGLLCLGLLTVLALQAAGMAFMAWVHASPWHVRPQTIFELWRLFGEEPGLRTGLRPTTALPAALALGLAIGLPWLAHAHRPRRPLHGAARFATTADVRAAGLYAQPSDPRPTILLGRHRGRFLALAGQRSVLLSAPTRSGKGVGVVIPNLLHWPDSAVVLDVKGENFAHTAGFRAERGQAVFAFAPFDSTACSHRWNPLDAVRNEPLHRVADLLGIGQAFFPNDGSGSATEGFFNDQARNFFLGLGLLMLETPGWPRTLGEMLRQSSGRGRPLRQHLRHLMASRQAQGQPLSPDCTDALMRLLSNSDNTLAGVVATLHAALTLFADAVVDAATSATDFDLAALRRQPMSVYVCIPPNRLGTARPLLNLFFSQVVSLNTHTLPEQDPTLRLQCLLLLDELAALGRMPMLAQAAAFLGGYNLRLLTVVQAMSQLDALYGPHEARSFATNHGLQILFAPREQRDAEDYSAMLGQFTEVATSRGRSRSSGPRSQHTVSRNDSDQRRPLLLPQEFRELGSERLVVVGESGPPILADKIRYHRDDAFLQRLRPPPPRPALDMLHHLAVVQRLSLPAAGRPTAMDDLDLDTPDHHAAVPTPQDTDPAHLAATLDSFFAGGLIERLDEATADDDAHDELHTDAVTDTGIDTPTST